ncbi:hypothetical protein EJ110_NYTH30258 [Nymphaea thermarum]|nr:hypothetical protein EJ110_NYTH30258 [Nymphaea thermarum]
MKCIFLSVKHEEEEKEEEKNNRHQSRESPRNSLRLPSDGEPSSATRQKMAFFCSFFLSISPPPNSCNLPQSPPLCLPRPLKPPAPKFMRMVMASSSRRGTIPARDMVIDYGKYRGRMLGTLPSSYLKWVSKNLRAGDYQEWADRADEVLADPVYADRIEWEHAQKILTGNEVSRVAGTRSHSNSFTQKPVSDLLDISRRFGWDNDDKEGWTKIDFNLLGTSKGGRIPRRLNDTQRSSGAVPYQDDGGSHRLSSSSSSPLIESNGNSDNVRSGFERRRELRRERQRMRKTEDGGDLVQQQHQRSVESSSYSPPSAEGERRNPFPGRQAILRKLEMNNRG